MKLKKLLLAGGATALMTASTAYASIIDRPFFQVLGVVVVWGADDAPNATNTAPVVSDFVLMTTGSGNAGADLIAADGGTVVTGTLTPVDDGVVNVDASVAAADPISGTGSGNYSDANSDGVLNAGDTLSAFGMDATTDVDGDLLNQHRSSFYVASNAVFDIYAQASNFASTGDFANGSTLLDETNIAFSMGMTLSGNDGLAFGANAVTTNPGTFPGTVADLGDMATPTLVFDGTSRTALTRGNLAAQSVRFDNTYTLDDGTGLGYDLSMGAGTVQADVTFTIYVP